MSGKQGEGRISRREFIKGAGLLGATAAGSTLLAGCGTTSAASVTWDRETDVVIVGYGGAGAVAAIAARDAGAEVIVLEKREVPGGSTAISGGLCYAAGTSVQQAAGIQDSADAMYQHYLNAGKGLNDPAQVRLAADRSADNVDWLTSLGATWPAPPSVSGAEVNVGSEPVARVHSPAYGDLSGGAAFFQVLADAATSKGAEILMSTAAKELVVGDDGAVVGVKAESGGQQMFIKARRAVILTTGGFTRSQEMMAGFSRDAFNSQPLGVPDLTGDGHRMAFALGADAINISEVLGIPGLTLPGAVAATYALWSFMPDIAAIFVNKNGKRFVDEFKFYDWKNTELLHQPDSIAFSVFDDATRQYGAGRIVAGFSETLEQEVTDGTVFKANTIGALANEIGVPAAAFEATITKWNEDVAAGVDTDWGRTAALAPIATAPFYAFKTYSTLFDNSGGIKINTDAQVVNTWGNVIPRLYAAGQVSGGVIGEHYPGSGTALNALVTFGRIAGAKVAAETPLT